MELGSSVLSFFELVFHKQTGYLCIATKNPVSGVFGEIFFQYPTEVKASIEHILEIQREMDVYFCPTLMVEQSGKKWGTRVKNNIQSSRVVWADLDYCHWSRLLVKPSLVIETSPNRYQGYWLLNEAEPASVVEHVNKRLAYHHAKDGVDISGFDLTQLLRVPLTYNFKYAVPTPITFRLTEATTTYDIADFTVIPEVDQTFIGEFEFPNTLPTEAGEKLIEQFGLDKHPTIPRLFEDAPHNDADWSKRLWQLELSCFEAGTPREVAYCIAKDSACNKYQRDGRSDLDLWKEIVRAYRHVQYRNIEGDDTEHIIRTDNLQLSPLLNDTERGEVVDRKDFVSVYTEWARALTDAAPQYHVAGAFSILSSLLSGAVLVPTSYGTMTTNLWFMLLADTTLSRKTTSMIQAMELLYEVDPDVVLATDGSIEGLLEALRTRTSRPSIFLRDEFTGLMESVARKDYMAGMFETLTKLYDGQYMKRVLRKDVVEVRKPVLIMFTGGVKSKMMNMVSEEHVTSGFLPRFIFITAEADVTKLRPMGPPTYASIESRRNLLSWMEEMHERFWSNTTHKTNTGGVHIGTTFNVELTPDAWIRYNEFEGSMVQDALASNKPHLLTPTMDRLAKSGLKCAALLAASEHQSDTTTISLTVEHLVRAFYFVERWREHTLYIVDNAGVSYSERKLLAVNALIATQPETRRSAIMRRFSLTSREADAILRTLEERQLITTKGRGNKDAVYISIS